MSENPFGNPSGFQPEASAQDVERFHRRSDVDSSAKAHHHTLGWLQGQAAPGIEVKAALDALGGGSSGGWGRVGDIVTSMQTAESTEWKLANGQLLNPATYPDLFTLFGTTYGGDGVTTFGLPDMRGKVMVDKAAAGTFSGAVGTSVGAETSDYSHSHTTPNHSHTGASHTHSLSAHTHTITHIHNLSAHTHTIANVAHSAAATGSSGANRVSLINGVASGNHNHGGVTGAPSTDLTGASSNASTGAPSSDTTGAETAGNTGNANPSTNSTTFTAGSATFSRVQPSIIVNFFVRVLP